ncbi:S8 family serine peptidase [Actinoplanes sp. NBRC 103695]|uniref:S8 family peptidase n=1 Tax=Actinoplanes sp. NBRC 103695 TaxID=3032202 RepID=UPI0024A31C27|nr:S8 family serine peptidase [Actinoplanes sp. NBRC 103695]GLY97314.1 peptidase [Actinoplanes sp. NBRC 103695]
MFDPMINREVPLSLLRLRGFGLVALTISSVAIVPAAARAAMSAPPSRPVNTVTLITGDKVTVAPDGGVQVRDPKGDLAGHVTNVKDGDTYVYPHDAFPYLATGRLDEDLFNVTELVADGYDDAHSSGVPLIVTYNDPAATARAALTGATDVRPLTSIGGAAMTADRSGRFLASAIGARSARAVKKIWLDDKARADLAESTAQIGAPEVWQKGNVGAGVDVAVLDTGIDTSHPDLIGPVSATTSFVPGESVEDGLGHGTHVASTIVGNGAASGGRERGVAPGARLHVGKVLDDEGFGQYSWIISGMEWAARDQHARVINLSLGGDATDGTDPMSVAVNQLSEETGALFVIAAGNAGPSTFTVGAPGAADTALTVGAVDSHDALASFSSQGPRLGNRSVKPDLTAPGVDILAARSRLSALGEGPYLSLSGTSMATPHVSGAAALVAAAHPGLSGQQLKDALVSTTKATPGTNAYQGGTGRLDVASTASATVFATGSVNFGYPPYPTAPTGPVGRDITYTNIGAAPVTLDLDSSLDLITLSAQRITVPAHGTATVTATTSFDRVPGDQAFAGYVTATGGLRTSVGGGREGVRRQLALRTRDRNGQPLTGAVVVLSRDRTVIQMIDETGALDLRLPEGTYTAYLTADVEGTHGPRSQGLAILPVTGIQLNGDRTVVFDVAKARRLTATTPQPSTVIASRFTLIRDITGNPWMDAWYPGPQYDSVWVLPTGKVPDGTLTASARWRLAQPALTVAGYDDLRVQQGTTPIPAGVRNLDAVLGGVVRGKALVVRVGGPTSIQDQAAAAASAGARLLLVVNDGVGRLEPWPGSVWMPSDPPPVTVATLTHDEGEDLIARIERERRVRLDVTSHPVTEYAYDLVHDYVGRVPQDLSYRATPEKLARVDMSFDNWRTGRALDQRYEIDTLGLTTYLDYAEAPARGVRTDWVTAGKKWISNVMIPGEQAQRTAPTAYRAGSVHPQRWFGPVQRPRLVDNPDGLNVFRQDDGWFFAAVPGWGDSGTAHAGNTDDNPDVDNRLALYQGDTVVGSADRSNTLLAAGPLPAEPLTYRLVSENNRDAWAGPYSTSTRTEWSFTSGAVKPGTVDSPPLIQLDYDVDTDRDGRAKRTFDLTIAASTLSTATNPGIVRSITLDVSYDDGATWHRADVRPRVKGWSTRISAPRAAQFVTLRTCARDTRGNTVEQRITRGFGLR